MSPAYGIYNGFELCENAPIPGREEYIHSEKYEYKVWDWDRPGNIKRDIAVLNRFRRNNPALHELTNLRFLDCADPNILAYAKMSGRPGQHRDRQSSISIRTARRRIRSNCRSPSLALRPIGNFRSRRRLPDALLLGAARISTFVSIPQTNPALVFCLRRPR